MIAHEHVVGRAHGARGARENAITYTLTLCAQDYDSVSHASEVKTLEDRFRYVRACYFELVRGKTQVSFLCYLSLQIPHDYCIK